MTTKEAAVRVELVYDDDPELLEELEPLRVVGQDRGVEHVRVRDHDLACRANGGPDGVGRVAVVRRGIDVQVRRSAQFSQFGHLVLAEGLCGEEEEGSRGWVVRQSLERGQEVAE